MKKLIILLPLLLLFAACELKQDWEVTTTTRTVQRSVQTWATISDKTEVSKAIVLDMNEKEIKDYCKMSSYEERFGLYSYTYYIKMTYVAIE